MAGKRMSRELRIEIERALGYLMILSPYDEMGSPIPAEPTK